MSTPLNQKVKTMNDEERNFIKSERIKEEFEEYKKFAYKKNFFVMALALVLAKVCFFYDRVTCYANHQLLDISN